MLTRRHFLRTTAPAATLVLPMSVAPAPRRPGKDFFRLRLRDHRWELLSPAGQPTLLRGVNHYGDGAHMPWNLTAAYGDAAHWRRQLRDRMRAWGFNYLPPSVGPSAIDPRANPAVEQLVTRTPEWPAAHYAALDFPFTIFLEVPKQYMSGEGMGDVFSEEFARQLDARCREVCLPLRDNPYLIGYHFCHNPPWHPQSPSFDQWIEQHTQPGSAGLAEWVRLMQRVYGTIDRWRETYGLPIRSWDDILTLQQPLRGFVNYARHLEDRVAFMRRICERWYRSYHDTIRRYDPNHLLLGDRNTLHLQPLPAYAIQTMQSYVDVLSVNVMGPPATVYGVLEQVTRHWDGPLHLSDTGGGVYTPGVQKSAYQARDLTEFEEIYGGLVRMTVEHPQLIGFGWCGYYDTPAPGARSGLVDVRTDEPLADTLGVARKWNGWMEENYPTK
ncbi:hypothetical protein [Neolewinella sp.]|uniref:hypothetical protein n=1 Tax=Neolewinella sp. TaxID=2993543 RepID=UPI003B52D150